ncbi:MAG: phage tail tape measure protein [Pseudomonadota bacterium]|nr:phage tail tape measure protein [Pseudomonadota bacterium]
MANKNLNAIITIGGAVAGSLRSTIGTTKSQLGQIGSEIRRVKKNQAELGKAIQTFGGMGKNVDNLRAKYSAVTAELGKLTRAQEKLSIVEQKRLKNEEHLSNLTGKIGATVGTAIAVLAPLKKAVDVSSDFNYQLQMIGNTADMSKAQIGNLRSEVMNVSKVLGKAPTEVLKAQGVLIAAGMDLATATKVLEPIGKTATATGASIEEVSKAANTLNDALNVAPDNMLRAMDALTQAGKEGNFEFKAMAENLPVLGASFNALKLQGVEAAATMGAALQIAKKGASDESEAANNMKNFMGKILAPDTLKKAKKYGVDLYGEITKAQKNGGNAFETAVEQVYKMTKGGDQKLVAELFGDMQVQNFLRPMMQNMDEYKRIKEAALNSAGVVDRDFIKMSETTQSQSEARTAAMQRLWVGLGTAIEPVLGKINNVVTPIISRFADFVEANPKVVASIVTVIAALTGLRVGVLGVRIGMALFNSHLLAGAGALARFGVSMGGTKAILGGVVTVIKQVGFALLRTPFGVVAAVAVAAGLAIYKYWDYIKAFFIGLWKGISEAIKPFTSAIGGLIQSTPILSKAWEWLGNVVGGVVQWFKDLLTPVNASAESINTAKSAGESFGKVVGAAINAVLTPLRAVVNLFTWIINNAGKAIDLAKTVASYSPVGLAYRGIKGLIGGDSKASASAPSQSKAPPVRGAPSSRVIVPNQISNSFTINTQPNQNPNQIADMVMQKLNRANGVSQRSSMLDAGYSQ